MENITVYYKEEVLLVPKEVANLHNLKDNYIIKSESKFLEILNASNTHNINRIKLIQKIMEKSIEYLN